MQDVNLKGAFLCCRAVMPYMKERRSGKIVNIASILALRGSLHYVTHSAGYSTLLPLVLPRFGRGEFQLREPRIPLSITNS